MDFQDVSHWQNNKLNRKDSSRMGWSDISISLSGPVVEDLRAHFVERWNFIYDEKYDVRKDTRYSRLTFAQNPAGAVIYQSPPGMPPAGQVYQPYRPQPNSTASQGQGIYSYHQDNSQCPPPPTPYAPNTTYPADQPSYDHQWSDNYPPPPPRPGQDSSYHSDDMAQPNYAQSQPAYASEGSQPYFPPPPTSKRSLGDAPGEQGGSREPGGYDSLTGHHHHHHSQQLESEARSLGAAMYGRFEQGKQYVSGNEHYGAVHGQLQEPNISGQIVRSCTKWSHGVPTEHSIANAYISVIENSRHFVYIENQFFITATCDAQKPVRNKIGAAIVARILRAARAGEKFKMIVIIPAVPGFAGDLKDDTSLGTRAIMEFQYNSINRGGHSIMESVAKEGYDPTEFISFYNLRNYDRLNISGSMRDAEQKSGVDYDVAREQHDEAVELPAESANLGSEDQRKYQQYQSTTKTMERHGELYTGRWDSVSECYMMDGKDIREVPWSGGSPEIEAFVSEELYIHSKVSTVTL